MVAGSTTSANFAVAVQYCSCTKTLSGFCQRAHQPREVLVMVERVAAGPIDQPDVGIGVVSTVVLERRAGVQQHVGDARDRDKFLHAIGALRQRWPRQARVCAADLIGGSVAERDATASKANLAEHRGERHRHPERLLAMRGALQRPGDVDHGALGRHFVGERGDARGGDAGDGLRPLRRLRLDAGQIRLEPVVAVAAAGQEIAVVPIPR